MFRPQDNWNPTKAQHEEGRAEQQAQVEQILQNMRNRPKRYYTYSPRYRKDCWGNWVEVR